MNAQADVDAYTRIAMRLRDLADADRLPSRVILRREPADLSWLGSRRRRTKTD